MAAASKTGTNVRKAGHNIHAGLMFIVIPRYAQKSSVIYIKITPTCFGVNTPS
jgi:hypothetical protein